MATTSRQLVGTHTNARSPGQIISLRNGGCHVSSFYNTTPVARLCLVPLGEVVVVVVVVDVCAGSGNTVVTQSSRIIVGSTYLGIVAQTGVIIAGGVAGHGAAAYGGVAFSLNGV